MTNSNSESCPEADVVTVAFDGVAERADLEPLIITLVESAAAAEGKTLGPVAIVITTDAALQALNAEYRDLDEPTDVLSFDLNDGAEDRIEGDLYISAERATVQAREAGLSPDEELIRLVAHGCLHLCGWTHDDDVSLRLMIERGENLISELNYRRLIGS